MSGVALWIGVAVLGSAGSVARFLVDGFVMRRTGSRFPLGTLTVNLVGAVLLGLLTGLAVSSNLMLLIGTALLGGFTTFSTWMFETQRLLENGETLPGVANVALPLVAGIGFAWAGWAIGGAL